MTISPSTWQAAQVAIAEAVKRPHLYDDERAIGQQIAEVLDDAVRRYGVGSYVHETHDAQLHSILNVKVLTAEQARQLLPVLQQVLNAHFSSYAAHWRPTQRTAPTGIDFAAANGLKASLNQHELEPSVHFNDDTANAVTAPDAVDDASLVTLVEAIRRATLAHIGSAGRLVVTRINTDAEYQRQLASYEQNRVERLKLISFAERVARAAAVAFNYTFTGSGLPHEITPWGRLEPSDANAQKIQERLMNLHEQGTFSDDPYFAVVRRAMQLLPVGGASNPPAPPGTATVVVTGAPSPEAESALNAAIQGANRFAAAAAVE